MNAFDRLGGQSTAEEMSAADGSGGGAANDGAAGSDPNGDTDESAGIEELLAETDGDQLWIVPAIAVETVPHETESTSACAEIPTLTALECQQCTRETEHRFRTRESLPDETWTGQPIWEYQVCSTGRYGPAPE